MADLYWLSTREHAETVVCPDCFAPAGQTCTRREPHSDRRVPLTGLPAHSHRIKAADHANAQEDNE